MATTRRRTTDVALDYSMKEKIEALYALQQIDSQIDEINKIKGELPVEVQDLEDEVTGLETRIANINGEINDLSQQTKQRKYEIDQAKGLIAKYEEQQKNVRNNREFDAISKEIEYQTLEIELCEKHLKEYSAEAKIKQKNLEDTQTQLNDRNIDLAAKKSELESIDHETAKEIDRLRVDEQQAQVKIDERLLSAYKRIRQNVHNGLAVVTVKRDACGGCYNRIPPQRQFEIRQNKKIIICEYCGRILVSDEVEQPAE